MPMRDLNPVSENVISGYTYNLSLKEATNRTDKKHQGSAQPSLQTNCLIRKYKTSLGQYYCAKNCRIGSEAI